MKKTHKNFLKFAFKNATTLLILMLFIFALEIYYLKNNFKLDTDFKALFNGKNKTILALKKLKKKAGNTYSISIVVKSDSREKNINFLKTLKSEIKKIDTVKFIEFDKNIDYLKEHSMLFLSVKKLKKIDKQIQKQIRKQIKSKINLGFNDEKTQKKHKKKSDLSQDLDNLTNKISLYEQQHHIRQYQEALNGKMMKMTVNFRGSDTSISQTKKVIAQLEKIVKNHNPKQQNIQVEVGGMFRNKVEEMKAMKQDLTSTLAICIFLLAFTIIFYFRSVWGVVVVMLPLSFGVVFAIAITLFLLGEFNIVSSFTFAIMYGLGIDFGIHLLSRYSEEKLKGLSPLNAMISTYNQTISAVFFGALTTAIAFFSLYFVEFKGFSDFGFVAGIGVISSFFAIILFLPVLVFFLEKIFNVKIRTRQISFLGKLFETLLKYKKTTLVSTAFLFIFALIFTFKMQFEYDLTKLSFPKIYNETTLIKEYNTAVKKEKTDKMADALPSFIFTNSNKETKDITQTLKQIKKERKYPVKIKDFISLYTFIPENQQEKLRIIKRIKRHIDAKINLFDDKIIKKYNKKLEPYLKVSTPLQIDKLPKWILNTLTEKNKKGSLVVVSIGGNKSNINTVVEVRKNYEWIKGKLKTYHLLGTYFLLADIKTVLQEDVPLSIILAFSVVFIVLIIMFKSIKRAFFISFSLAFGIILMIGIASLFGVKFNLFNLIVVPTVIGIGIDSAIHIYHRFLEDGNQKMMQILEKTGGAVLFSSITTLVGFLSLAFAKHNGLKSMGIIASIGIFTVTFTNIILLPVFLKIFSEKKEKKQLNKSKN